ncbi:MAG: VOC family protein [Acidobacteria bacterium]|nr:VOC family protein [Acidobacteriota bacterium]MCA1607869.1 VOC family protein [Acidobacteriota bacterium]
MPTLSPYLNFHGNAEDAFNFYKSVFGGEFMGGIMRFGDMPDSENLSEEDKNKVMHVGLPLGDSWLMASDLPESMGKKFTAGNSVQVMISPDSREEADRLFKALSESGKVEMPMADQFWGAYYGEFADKFGVNWMIHYNNNPQK